MRKAVSYINWIKILKYAFYVCYICVHPIIIQNPNQTPESMQVFYLRKCYVQFSDSDFDFLVYPTKKEFNNTHHPRSSKFN